MKQSLKILIVLELLLIPLLLLSVPASASEGAEPILGSDGKYHFRIETSQWEIKAYDLVDAEARMSELGVTDMEQGFIEGKFKPVEQKHRVGSFLRGSTMVIEVYSRDVQHGFSINEVDVAVATLRPDPGNSFGGARIVEFDWPDEDVTISSFCHIFCGLGHPDMKLKFKIGAGSLELGPPLFYAIIILNVLIFAVVGNKIWNKLD